MSPTLSGKLPITDPPQDARPIASTTAVIVICASLLNACAGQSWNRDYRLRYWEKYRVAGESAYFKRDYKRAAELFKDAVFEAESLGSNDFRLGVSLSQLADANRKLGNHAEAEEFYNRALAILKNVAHSSREAVMLTLVRQDTARILSSMALMYAGERKFDLAAVRFERAIKVYDGLCKVTDDGTLRDNFLGQEEVRALDNLARTYVQQKKYDQAGMCFKKALKLARLSKYSELATSEISARYLGMLKAIGTPLAAPDVVADQAWQESMADALVFMSEKRWKEAETCLIVCEQATINLPERSDRAVKTFSQLANVYLMTGRVTEAEIACQRATRLVNLAEEDAGAFDLDQALAQLATYYVISNQGKRALPALAAHHALRCKLFGPDSIQAADILAAIARALVSCGSYAQANKVADEAKAIVVPKYASSKRGMHAVFELAQVYQMTRNLTAAEQMYRAVLLGAQTRYGSADEKTISASQCLITVLLSEKKNAEAMDLTDSVIKTLTNAKTEQLKCALPYAMMLGDTCLQMGYDSQAGQLYRLICKIPPLGSKLSAAHRAQLNKNMELLKNRTVHRTSTD